MESSRKGKALFRLGRQYFRGYLKIRITGYSPERFLNLCHYHQIRIWGIMPKDGGYELYLSLTDLYRLKPILRKSGTHFKMIRRYGFPFFLAESQKRIPYFAGGILCVLLIFFYTCFVWQIKISGTHSYSEEEIRRFLWEHKVSVGSLNRRIDCKATDLLLRNAFDRIVWVTTSIEGGCLKVQIREKEEQLEVTGNSDSVSEDGSKDAGDETQDAMDLVAAKDGTITDIITRNGVPLVKAGDSVKKGQILVSGQIPIYNDSKEIIAYEACQADADILAKTTLDYADSLSLAYQWKDYEKKREIPVFFFQINGMRIQSGKIKRNQKKMEVYSTERTFGEDTIFPITCGKIIRQKYTQKEKKYSREELQKILTERFQEFREGTEKKGVQITGNSVKIHIGENQATARGTVRMTEPIGERSPSHILTLEERNETNESFGNND